MSGSPIFPIDPPGLHVFLVGFYGYFLPFLLQALWATLAIVDIGRRQKDFSASGAAWAFSFLLLPLISPAIYLLFVAKSWPLWLVRFIVLAGGGFYLAILIFAGSALV